ncbi:MAG: substrate-binding domain-containing protein, partial [bacterium]|nr:substrate-binding domain-containing protein [bacterium]
TARRALNELEQENFLRRIPGKGTYVASTLPILKNFSESREIGVVFHDVFKMTEPSIARFLEGAAAVAQHFGYVLHIFTTMGRSIFAGNSALCHSIEQKNLAGLLLLSPMEEAEIKRLMASRCPFVVVSDVYAGMHVPTVYCDDSAVAYNAAKEFLSQGHRKITLAVSQRLPVMSHIVRGRERMSQGYTKALKEYGVDDINIIINYLATPGQDTDGIKKDICKALGETTAFIVSGDSLALEICNCIREQGKVIGKDVDLFVYGDSSNIPDARIVRKPFSKMGEHAVRKLINMQNGLDDGGLEAIVIDCVEPQTTPV